MNQRYGCALPFSACWKQGAARLVWNCCAWPKSHFAQPRWLRSLSLQRTESPRKVHRKSRCLDRQKKISQEQWNTAITATKHTLTRILLRGRFPGPLEWNYTGKTLHTTTAILIIIIIIIKWRRTIIRILTILQGEKEKIEEEIKKVDNEQLLNVCNRETLVWGSTSDFTHAENHRGARLQESTQGQSAEEAGSSHGGGRLCQASARSLSHGPI